MLNCQKKLLAQKKISQEEKWWGTKWRGCDIYSLLVCCCIGVYTFLFLAVLDFVTY